MKPTQIYGHKENHKLFAILHPASMPTPTYGRVEKVARVQRFSKDGFPCPWNNCTSFTMSQGALRIHVRQKHSNEWVAPTQEEIAHMNIPYESDEKEDSLIFSPYNPATGPIILTSIQPTPPAQPIPPVQPTIPAPTIPSVQPTQYTRPTRIVKKTWIEDEVSLIDPKYKYC